MVSTVWPVSCLLFFYSRCSRVQPFVKVGARAPRALWVGATGRLHALEEKARKCETENLPTFSFVVGGSREDRQSQRTQQLEDSLERQCIGVPCY